MFTTGMKTAICYKRNFIHIFLVVLVGLLQLLPTTTTCTVNALGPSVTRRITRTTSTTPTTASSLYTQQQKSSSSSSFMSPRATNDQLEEEAETSPPSTSLTLGFIGCGTIASAIVTGLATAGPSSSSSIITSRNSKNTQDGSPDTSDDDGDGTSNSSNMVVKLSQIIVSRRSEKNSRALKEQFPSLIVIEDDNQAIVDAADIIFVALLPKQTKDVLQSLRFDKDSDNDNDNNGVGRRRRRPLLVSLVSTTKLDELIEYSGLPSDSVYKMICLPAVSRREGICILTPPIISPSSPASSSSLSSAAAHDDDNSILDGWLVQLLHQLGDVVQADSEEQMAIMTVPSALMGSFYGILRNNQRWLMQQGIPSDKAGLLIGRFYQGMMQDAAEKLLFIGDVLDDQQQEGATTPSSSRSAAHGATPELDELIAEQTPGGLNEQGLENLSTLGALKAYDQVQDCILARIQGTSDGSLLP